MKAFICDGVRTPIGRYGGALSSIRADDLASIPIKALLERNKGLQHSKIDEVIWGAANQAGEDNRNVARMASLLAGMPVTVPGTTVNRLCASGMDAVIFASRAIKSSEQHVLIAGGSESMSRAPFVLPKSEQAFGRTNAVFDTTIGWRFINQKMKAEFGVHSMPQTADNVAADYGVSREDQDLFALQSQQRWAAAHSAGRFEIEVVPVEVTQPKRNPELIAVDEHPRPDATLEKLSKLKGVNGPSLSVTAGNASGVNDGAAAVLMASEQGTQSHKLTPLARVVASASAGVEPRIMGVGPVTAVKKALALAGLSLEQIDVIELNEAFAAQSIAVLSTLGVNFQDPRVNPNGGAIAMGHPLGMSGARIVLTAAYELQKTNKRFALCTMCVGVGQGTAIIIERV